MEMPTRKKHLLVGDSASNDWLFGIVTKEFDLAIHFLLVHNLALFKFFIILPVVFLRPFSLEISLTFYCHNRNMYCDPARAHAA